MNKFKKIAAGAVSLVMAGSMAVGFTACGDGNDDKKPTGDSGAAGILAHMKASGIEVRNAVNSEGWETAKSYWTYLSSGAGKTETKDLYGVRNTDGSLKYSAYSRGDVTLNIAVGHDKKSVSTSYQELGATITMPDGNRYTDGDLKPAWKQMGTDLNIKFNDVYKGWKTSNNLTNIIKGESGASYTGTDLFTTDLSVAVASASAGTKILNLADYLDYMPHFKEFLEANPVVYLSLLQSGMNTTTGAGKTILVAPYFDGNNDIERYCIMRQDWVKKLLDETSVLPASGASAFNSACAAEVKVESFIGNTGKITVESTKTDGSGQVNIVKN